MMTTHNQTAHKILDCAEEKVQKFGFNGFSFKDLQKEMGIKTASIHYYFATKQDLILALLERYMQNFDLALKEIKSKKIECVAQLEALADIYAQGIKQNKFCVCGMLASDLMSLSDAVHLKLKRFFNDTQSWIETVIIFGQKSGQFQSTYDPKFSAFVFLSALEGAMLIARTTHDIDQFNTGIQQAILQMT